MASRLIITRDNKTRNHQEGKETVKALRLCWVVEITLWVLNRLHHQTPSVTLFFFLEVLKYEFHSSVLGRRWKLLALSVYSYDELFVILLFSCI